MPKPAPSQGSTAPQRNLTELATADSGKGQRSSELQRLLYEAINRHKQYPTAALRLGREGVARVAFRLLPDGQLERLLLAASSGTGALDRAAMDAVRKISPFQPAAHYLDRAQQMEVDIVFRLYSN